MHKNLKLTNNQPILALKKAKLPKRQAFKNISTCVFKLQENITLVPMFVSLAHFQEQTLSFFIHPLKSIRKIVVNDVLGLHHLLHGLHVLRVGVDGHPDVKTCVVVQVGDVLGEVGLRGEEGVVQDLMGLNHHLVQVGVEPLALLRQLPQLVHILPDQLLADALLRGGFRGGLLQPPGCSLAGRGRGRS